MASVLEFPTVEELMAMMSVPWGEAQNPLGITNCIAAPEVTAQADMSIEEMIKGTYLMVLELSSHIGKQQSTINPGILGGTIDAGAILMGNPAQP